MKQILNWLISPALVFLCLCACQKELYFETGATDISKAEGSLTNTPGQCSPIVVSGTYQKGKNLAADSFYILVQVTVTNPGTYLIKTELKNGFMFADSGTFSGTGTRQIKLKASGTPLDDVPTLFNCYFDNSVCSFTVDVTDNAVIAPIDIDINTWQFTDLTNGSFHSGIIDTTKTLFYINSSWNRLRIWGWPGTGTPVNTDTIFWVTLFLPGPTIDTGIYNIGSGTGGEHFFGYANNIIIPGVGSNLDFYYYVSYPLSNPDFTFRILSYDSGQKLLKGSFYGTTRWQANYNVFSGSTHSISGSFYLKLN